MPCFWEEQPIVIAVFMKRPTDRGNPKMQQLILQMMQLFILLNG
jgi:hypothetical protein